MPVSPKVVCVSLAFVALSQAGAQSPSIRFSGTLENYYIARTGQHGAQHRITWMQIQADVGSRLQLVATNSQTRTSNFLDETYAEYDGSQASVKAGVMRSAFGFSDWGEQWYTGINDPPMIRSQYVADGLNLYRLDTGVQVSGGNPDIQYQAGLVDIHRSSRQFFPDKMDHGILRLQTAKGPFILGASFLQQVDGSDPERQKLYGIDLRWTAPQVQFRLEADQADSVDGSTRGFYADVFYRPPKSTKTRLVARSEAYRAYDSGTALHYALGIRQVLNENFTVSLNYGFGNDVSPAPSLSGWSIRLMSSIHF